MYDQRHEAPLGPDPEEDRKPERDDGDAQYERMRDQEDERRAEAKSDPHAGICGDQDLADAKCALSELEWLLANPVTRLQEGWPAWFGIRGSLYHEVEKMRRWIVWAEQSRAEAAKGGVA